MRRLLPGLLLAAILTAHAGPPPVTVSEARVRWLPGDLPMAGYFGIVSHAPGPLRLVGASSPAFGEVMLHRSREASGMARMESVHGVTLNPDLPFVFAPGGYHLMLMQRKRELQPGDEVPVTLEFSDGETLTVRFTVVGARGQ